MPKRKIVHIDEAKCDGCGNCVPSCAEGAIQIINGKARLVADVYCDGLGACLGECPQGAIQIIEREAAVFDEEAVHAHLAPSKASACAGSCPGTAVQSFGLPLVEPRHAVSVAAPAAVADETHSALGHWPIQLHLVPPGAAFLQGADLLLVADCVPFALPDFHARFLHGRAVAIGCPKLDDKRAYVEKLAAILAQAGLRSLTVVHMEVPCCMGLVQIAHAAQQLSGVTLPITETTISVRGQVKG